MNLFGFEISRRTKAIPSVTATGQLSSVEGMRGWWPLIRESFAGAFQQNEEITVDNVTTHPTVFACVTLIAADIAKMRMRLVQQDRDDIWNEVANPAFSPVLRKPNHFQTRIQFFESWMISKLLFGNTYVLKIRDERQVVVGLYVLDASRVRVLQSPNGDVFYQVPKDELSQLPQEQYTLPSTEIIHDRFNCLKHPLVGLSPIYANGLLSVQGLNIINSSTYFFGNGSTPGGVITAPGAISKESADRIKAYWETGFTGSNAGKVAVLADNMTFEQLKVSAVDAQLIEQLKWSAEQICSVFHLPPYMVDVGPMPNYYNNTAALNKKYYLQCLQRHAEDIELLLDEGLRLTEGENAANRYGTEFDIDDLSRMDPATMVQTLDKGKNYFTPNEGRLKLGLRPVEGGDTVYRQQQDFSLEALSKRDAQPDPFVSTRKPAATVTSAPAPQAQLPAPPKALLPVQAETTLAALLRKDLGLTEAA